MTESERKRRESGKYNEWLRNNKDKLKKYNQKKQNKKHKISKKEWEACKSYFNYRCAYCGLHMSEHLNRFRGEIRLTDFHKEHVDHEGLNDLSNCVSSCKSCNSQKHDLDLTEWYNKENPSFSQERLNKIHKWLIEDYKLYID